ncbi:hypothetical protein RUND412_002085 [Rhizina undulata]
MAPDDSSKTKSLYSDLELIERDESGAIIATFRESSEDGDIRIVTRKAEESPHILQRLINVFMPAGYPATVTEDYLGYQIYDSLQAFSSSIAGLLTSRAVLQGYGVGDANASATNALLLTILQDSVGRIATILFAYRFGIALESECKKYRLAADVFNDAAMLLDCLSPAFPKGLRIAMLCLSGSLRALCGVAAGGSKASLSVHFAKSGNVGELNAKDSSQETVISLIGMLAGSFVVSHITSTWATWTALIFLLGIHLGTNYKAVNAVALRTLNRQRANIVFSTLQEEHIILTPQEVAKCERIFERDGVLRWNSEVLGYAEIGVKLEVLVRSLEIQTRRPQEAQHSMEDSDVRLSDVAKVFQMQQYIMWHDVEKTRVMICLKSGITAPQQLKAWVHALIVAKEIRDRIAQGGKTGPLISKKMTLDIIEKALRVLSLSFEGSVERLRSAGWDLSTAALETRPGYRVAICLNEISDAVYKGHNVEEKAEVKKNV